jgi:hypothetical protein
MSQVPILRLLEETGLLLGELYRRREAALPDLNAYLVKKRQATSLLSDVELIGVLRYTFSVKEHLAEWAPLRDAVLTELTLRHGGAKAEALLRGLLPEVTTEPLPSV